MYVYISYNFHSNFVYIYIYIYLNTHTTLWDLFVFFSLVRHTAENVEIKGKERKCFGEKERGRGKEREK